MIDPNKVTEAVMEFMQNPTWKDIFINAPGGAMERLAISFYFSKFHDQFKPEDFQEYRDLRDEYEKSMTAEDLQYLIDNSDKENAIKHYQELLDKIQGGQQPTGTLRFEKEGTGGAEGDSGEQTVTSEVSSEQTEETKDGEEPTNTEAIEEAQEQTQNEGGTDAPPEEEKPPEWNESATESNQEDKDGGEEEQKPDEKYDTALSVALNYLQNEDKQMNGSAEDEKKK
ncbi:MAG: hypothetical protein J6Q22_10775 [Prevotella sp.]|nr:hypothetical protein [Prevotella sp.]